MLNKSNKNSLICPFIQICISHQVLLKSSQDFLWILLKNNLIDQQAWVKTIHLAKPHKILVLVGASVTFCPSV